MGLVRVGFKIRNRGAGATGAAWQTGDSCFWAHANASFPVALLLLRPGGFLTPSVLDAVNTRMPGQ